jgi:N-acetyltransferase
MAGRAEDAADGEGRAGALGGRQRRPEMTTGFDYQPTLRGELLLLRPLRPEDFGPLHAAAADPAIWEQHQIKDRHREEVFRPYFDSLLASQEALVVIDRASGSVIGMSRFHGYDPEGSEVEIGWTFLARAYWGGVYNGELKELMLRHAFARVRSVVFLVSPGNLRSRRAVEKLGAVRIGRRPDASGSRSITYRLDAPDARGPRTRLAAMGAETRATPTVPPPSVRAQLLATEHWSLLASRSTTQNELLVRIAIFLTLVSASIVSLALIGQATDFDDRFDAFAIVLFSILLLVGTLTLLRVFNGSTEDAVYVIGMNRLRAAYAELDPGIDRYFVTSTHDDTRGISKTYAFYEDVSSPVQVLASSAMLILVVDVVVAGVLAGLVANAADGSGTVIAIAAAAAAAAYILAWAWYFARRIIAQERQYDPMFPHPAE